MDVCYRTVASKRAVTLSFDIRMETQNFSRLFELHDECEASSVIFIFISRDYGVLPNITH
jgi:hypothetical protein